MKLTKSIYQDSKGNEWVIQQESLPKKKGTYTYWVGECTKLNKSFREDKKKDLKNIIEKSIV